MRDESSCGAFQRPHACARLTLPLLVAAGLAMTACGGSPATSAGSTSTTTGGPSTSTSTSTTGPPLSTALPPWPLPGDAAPYITEAGLSVAARETLAVHYHAHLDIMVNGQAVPVAAGLGFLIRNGQAVGLTSLHTHDATGIIHVESPVDVPFRLGQLFTEWGVKLDATHMGGLATGNGNELRLYVDGSQKAISPDQLPLQPHQEIVLWYGPVSAQPEVPVSYAFPAGD